MRPTRPLLAILLVAATLAGCLGARASPVDVTPYLPLNDAQPGRGTEFALFLHSTSSFKETYKVASDGLPSGWTFEAKPSTLDLGGGRTSFVIARVTPSLDAAYGPHSFDVTVGDTHASVLVNVKNLGTEPLQAGIGAEVSYVLFAENGSVLETNEPTVRSQQGLAYAPLDNGTPDYTPLNVYVGGQRGTPPPEPYNSTGCTQPPCYHPVIEGFDARLRDAGDGEGMVAGETLAVHIPKERAYTYPGNEKHPLYGQDLNFLIRIVSVDNLGKRCSLPVCVPSR